MTKWDKASDKITKNNPFTLTFAKEPVVAIERNRQRKQIVEMFNDMVPSNMVYMITGARGTGKTVMLSDIIKVFFADPDWEVIDLNPLQDMLTQLDGRLKQGKGMNANVDVTLKTPEILGMGAQVAFKNVSSVVDLESSIEKTLDRIKKQGRRVFIAIDDASNTEHMKLFVSTYQRLVRHEYPVYMVMTGICKELDSLQNEKSLTFLTRAPKILIENLRTSQISEKYREILQVDNHLADDMAHMVKGYTYGFQVLGYVAWNYLQSHKRFVLEDVIDEFDKLISDCSYDKIWVDLSERDREVLYTIARLDNASVESIRNELNMTSSSFSTYRMRLIKQGVISAVKHGYLEISLPRFGEYAIRQYEDID